MRKLYYFFVGSGKVLFIWMVMLVISISLYSVSIKGKVNYGDRCKAYFDDETIKNYSYEGIVLEVSELECNTYYLEYSSNLNEKENSLFLISLAKLLYDENIEVNVHVIIRANNYQMIATIVDYSVSFTTTLL